MLRFAPAFFFLCSAIGCGKNEPAAPACDPSLITITNSYHALINSLPGYVIEGLTKQPDASGALGRNREGYFHVRFQLDIGFLAAYAVKFNSDQALEGFVRAAVYSFDRQKPAGDFELVIPADLQSLGTPSAGDLASGTSFFLSALGSSLVLLQQSPWYQARPADNLTAQLQALAPQVQGALAYLKTQQTLLKQFDADAPNRLLFDAVAFYSLGLYLNDAEAKAIGTDFIQAALRQQAPAGYLTEGGGHDSSYNGVALRLGLVLLGMVPTTESIYAELQQTLSCCAQWQASRVAPSGEISLEGNTRVYPGGEKFLGVEKQIAWIETLMSFYFTAALSSNAAYTELAQRVEGFYR